VKRLLFNFATAASLMLCILMLFWWGSALRVPADLRVFYISDGNGGALGPVPLWLPTAVFALLPAWRTCWAVALVAIRRNRRRAVLCVRCGYDVRATLARCPECGADPRRSTGAVPRRATDVLGAAIATAVCFAGFAASGFYSTVVQTPGAAFSSFIFLLLTLSSATWCIVEFVLHRRRRRFGRRGLAMVATAEGGDASGSGSGG